MAFNTFKKNIISEIKTRIDQTNLQTASDTELILAGAMYKIAGIISETDIIDKIKIQSQ